MLWERLLPPHFITRSFSVVLCGYKLQGIDAFKTSHSVKEVELQLQSVGLAERRRLQRPKSLNIYA